MSNFHPSHKTQHFEKPFLFSADYLFFHGSQDLFFFLSCSRPNKGCSRTTKSSLFLPADPRLYSLFSFRFSPLLEDGGVMDPTEPRYFLRSGGKRARADDSDADGEWLPDDLEVIHDDAWSREDDELAASPETPTPAPRANVSGAERPTSQLGNNTTRAPAPVSRSRPLRRLLFPEAATPGRRARQFLPARPSLRGNPIPAVANRPSSSVASRPAGLSSVTLGGYAAGRGGLSGYQVSWCFGAGPVSVFSRTVSLTCSQSRHRISRGRTRWALPSRPPRPSRRR